MKNRGLWSVSLLAGVAGACVSASAAPSGLDYSPVLLTLQPEAPPVEPPAEVSGEEAPKPAQPESFFDGWTGTVEGGLNGSSGNSENFNIRGGVGAERKTDDMVTTASVTYKYATSEGEKTDSRGELNVRNDWNFGKDSPWGWFVLGKVEYDEFQDWRWRVSAYTGPSYALIRTDKTTLKLRAGFGFSREFGGERNDIVPELDLGADFEHQLTERQKIYASFDYYPSLSDFPEYRTVAKAGWEILVDPEVNMTLKLGIEHRHDSNPGDDVKKNDLDYFALIAFKF